MTSPRSQPRSSAAGRSPAVVLEPCGRDRARARLPRRPSSTSRTRHGALRRSSTRSSPASASRRAARASATASCPTSRCYGKALGNGMPDRRRSPALGAMAIFEEVFFSGTHGGEALSLAAARAVLDDLADGTVLGSDRATRPAWLDGRHARAASTRAGVGDRVTVGGRAAADGRRASPARTARRQDVGAAVLRRGGHPLQRLDVHLRPPHRSPTSTARSTPSTAGSRRPALRRRRAAPAWTASRCSRCSAATVSGGSTPSSSIGAGSIGRRHCANLLAARRPGDGDHRRRPGAARRRRRPARRRGRRRHPRVASTVSWSRARRRCTPRADAAAGAPACPVFVEKPLACYGRRRPRHGKRAATVCVGYNLRFVTPLVRVVDGGTARPDRHIRLGPGLVRQWLPGLAPRRGLPGDVLGAAELGGGVLFDAIHELDQIVWMPATTVRVVGATVAAARHARDRRRGHRPRPASPRRCRSRSRSTT